MSGVKVGMYLEKPFAEQACAFKGIAPVIARPDEYQNRPVLTQRAREFGTRTPGPLHQRLIGRSNFDAPQLGASVERKGWHHGRSGEEVLTDSILLCLEPDGMLRKKSRKA